MPRYQILRELLRYNGKEFGENSTVEMEQSQAEPLLALGALAMLSEDAAVVLLGLRQDGPTVEEFVAAGYSAKGYPPPGYAAISSDEDVAIWIALEEKAADSQSEGGSTDAGPNTEIQPGAESTNGLNGDDAAGAGALASAAESTHSTTEVQTQTEGAEIAPAGGQAPATTDNPESPKQEAPGEAPPNVPAPTQKPGAPQAQKGHPKTHGHKI